MLAVAKNDAGRDTPINDASLRSLAQDRAETMAKRDSLNPAVVSSLPSALTSKGYSPGRQLVGSHSSGDPSFVAEKWISSSRQYVVNPDFTRLGVGTATATSGKIYAVALYAEYKAPVKATPKPVVPPAPVQTTAPKPVETEQPKPKPTTKPSPTTKPKPSTKPSQPSATPKPKPSPSATPSPSPTPDPRVKEIEAALLTAEQKAKQSEDERVAMADLAKQAEVERAASEEKTVELQRVAKTTATYGSNGLLAAGFVLLLAASLIRRKPHVEIPQWEQDAADN